MRIAPRISPSLSLLCTILIRCVSSSCCFFVFDRFGMFERMCSKKSSKDIFRDETQESMFLLTIVAIDRLPVALFLRSGDLSTTKPKVKKWTQDIKLDDSLLHAVIILSNSAAT